MSTTGTYEVTTVDARGYILADYYTGTDWDAALEAVRSCVRTARDPQAHSPIAEIWLMDSVNGRTTFCTCCDFGLFA